MSKDEIHLNDLGRILFGNAPGLFVVEVLFRSIIIYCFLLVCMRLLGKKMSGQLDITEMAVMLMLGAIVSSAMQLPQMGMLEGMFVLALVVIFQRSLTYWMLKRPKMERITQGEVTMLVKNGTIQTKSLLENRVSREQLLGSLRKHQVINLGKVRRAYLEPSGGFSVYEFNDCRPGLSILPDDDPGAHTNESVAKDWVVCKNCGNAQPADGPRGSCMECGVDHWITAIT
ncbi:MAG TPA: YetF domain-containing protein [Chitinophagaceae bacterium]|jgi:uncharacterized membrane protein YcaP (DUF421 family)